MWSLKYCVDGMYGAISTVSDAMLSEGIVQQERRSEVSVHVRDESHGLAVAKRTGHSRKDHGQHLRRLTKGVHYRTRQATAHAVAEHSLFDTT